MINVIKVLFVLFTGVTIAGISFDRLRANDEEDVVAQSRGWNITVSPSSFQYDDEILVTISGLPSNFPFDTNSVTLGGTRLDIPNRPDSRYRRPLSDGDGKFVFETEIPTGLSSGEHHVRVDIRGIFVAKALVVLEPIGLRVSSSVIVPHQEVWVIGMGFTKSSDIEGRRSATIDEMNSTSTSSAGVTLGGELVHDPHIEYPVILGRDGSVFFKMVVPKFGPTLKPGQVKLEVTDSQGREGVATLTVSPVTLLLSNFVSYPGETVPFEITGLPAPRKGFNDYVELVYGYAIDETGAKHVAKPLGTFTPDAYGGVSGSLDIPRESLLSSSNKVWVTGSNGGNWYSNHYLAGRSIGVEPASGLQGDPILITIKGMPSNYPLTVGSVRIGEDRVVVPGHIGVTGSRPVSDDVGSLAFKSYVPTGVRPGEHHLTWDPPGGGSISSAFYVMEGKLLFAPSVVTPGQRVTMTSESNATEARGVEISGIGESYVYIDGVKKFREVIDYPIKVSKAGELETSFYVPINDAVSAQNSLEFTTLDTIGRVVRGTLYLKQRAINVTPPESVRGSLITVEGTGFFANSSASHSIYRVQVSYRGELMRTVILDEIGAFQTSFTVPADAVVGDINQITVVMEGFPSLKVESEHRVPEAAVYVTPRSALPGDYIVVTGEGFAPFRQVTIIVGHLWASNSGPCESSCDLVAKEVHTDITGQFKMFLEVPTNLPKGSTELKVYAHYPIEVASISFDVR